MYRKNRRFIGRFFYSQDERVKKNRPGASWEASGHGERYGSVYEENLTRLISEMLKQNMILLTTRRTKEKL